MLKKPESMSQELFADLAQNLRRSVRGRRLLLVSVQGSRLYGIETPTSDWDVKGVFLPSINGLDRGERELTVDWKRKKDGPEGCDMQLWPLSMWLKNLAESEFTSIDMFFSATCQHSAMWVDMSLLHLLDAPRSIIPSGGDAVAAYVSYAQRQAKSLAVRVEHAEAVALCIKVAEEHAERGMRLAELAPALIAAGVPGFTRVLVEEAQGEKPEQYGFEVCRRKFHETQPASKFLETMRALLAKYGERVKQAKTAGGDGKSMGHAWRAAWQAIQIKRHGFVHFPLPDDVRETIMGIRTGRTAPEDAKHMVESLIAEAVDEAWSYDGVFDKDFVHRWLTSLR